MALDFPSSPTNGQVYGGYVWDGEKWLATGSGAGGGGGGGGINIPFTTESFGPEANISRLGSRTLFASAVVNDGVGPTYSMLDWLSQLNSVSYNGGNGIGIPGGSETNFATVGVLTDHNSEIATLGGHQLGILVATQSATGKEGRALEKIAVNNSMTGNPTVWADYSEAHRVGTTINNTYTVELQVRNSVNLQKGDPYQAPNGGTYALSIGAGAGLSAAGQFDATTAITITSNPKSFAAGLSFANGAIGAHGPGGIKPAIQLPVDHEIVFYSAPGVVAGRIRSSPFNILVLTPGAGGGVFIEGNINLSDSKILQWGEGSTYIGGTAAGQFINTIINNVERERITTAGHSFNGTTSGAVTVTPQAVAGSPTLTFPNANGTFAVSATAPLALNATTGDLSFANTPLTAFTSQWNFTGGTGTGVVSNTGSYLQMGKMLYFEAETLINYSTPPTGISITIPNGKSMIRSSVIGGMKRSNGAFIFGNGQNTSTALVLTTYGGALPVAASGQILAVNGWIEVN